MADAAIKLKLTAHSDVTETLSQALADTTVTTMLAQNFHWNVTGMGFGPLHALFQEIYEDHFAAQDSLAERIRSLDVFVDGSFAAMTARATIKECGGPADATVMIATLQQAQETLGATLTTAAKLAGERGDVVTEDLCIGRAHVHDKFAWMLRAHLA